MGKILNQKNLIAMKEALATILHHTNMSLEVHASNEYEYDDSIGDVEFTIVWKQDSAGSIEETEKFALQLLKVSQIAKILNAQGYKFQMFFEDEHDDATELERVNTYEVMFKSYGLK